MIKKIRKKLKQSIVIIFLFLTKKITSRSIETAAGELFSFSSCMAMWHTALERMT